MRSIILFGIVGAAALYLIVQGVRCNIAVNESEERLATYEAKTITLSYGDMTYVDKGKGDVILPVHGIFGGHDQAYDTCQDIRNCRKRDGREEYGIRLSSVD